MHVFKNNVVAYAQDKKHTDMKSLYLYKGQLRIGKAYIKQHYLQLTFQSAVYAQQWDIAYEQVDDVPWLFRNFSHCFKLVHTDYDYMRVYRKN